MKWITLLLAIVACGCSQQVDRPWQHEPTPDHWLESYWLTETEAAAKDEWERENPPTSVAEYLLR
jgi:hypothetical protein